MTWTVLGLVVATPANHGSGEYVHFRLHMADACRSGSGPHTDLPEIAEGSVVRCLDAGMLMRLRGWVEPLTRPEQQGSLRPLQGR